MNGAEWRYRSLCETLSTNCEEHVHHMNVLVKLLSYTDGSVPQNQAVNGTFNKAFMSTRARTHTLICRTD